MAETAAQRFDRDYGHVETDRRVRELDHQTLERLQRIYVNSADGTTPADDNHIA